MSKILEFARAVFSTRFDRLSLVERASPTQLRVAGLVTTMSEAGIIAGRGEEMFLENKEFPGELVMSSRVGKMRVSVVVDTNGRVIYQSEELNGRAIHSLINPSDEEIVETLRSDALRFA